MKPQTKDTIDSMLIGTVTTLTLFGTLLALSTLNVL